MKKFICDLQLADADVLNPSKRLGYEYLVRADTALVALDIIMRDLGLTNGAEFRVVDLYFQEDTTDHTPFPVGEGVVSRRGPITLKSVEQKSFGQILKSIIGK